MLNDNYELKNGGYSTHENTKDLPRHRWYYYKEGFSPLLVEKAIEKTGISKKDIILDPFNGSGTSTLTASLKGYNSIGIEVNPFTSFLSETKTKNANIKELNKWKNKVLLAAHDGKSSSLIGYSTFSKTNKINKWLFNHTVLKAFEGGWNLVNNISPYNIRRLLKLALISSAMQNCNATRDGKCLRYRDSWEENGFNRDTFINSFDENVDNIKSDIEASKIIGNSIIYNGDARKILKQKNFKFKLCITSPPYLNTFDYTDIYRPELFLGKFVKDSEELYNLRLRTVRSHIQAKWKSPLTSNFGLLYNDTINYINEHKINLMSKRIPLMIQAYFEDMSSILSHLKRKAEENAEVWLIVSNSAYADKEVPVDLIIGDIGSNAGWNLKEIGVLRNIRRRVTRYSPNITTIRESLVRFTINK